MLKLQKNSRDNEITISLLDRERFLNRSLLQALSIAIGLHLLAMFVFNIRLFHFGQEEGLLPPTFVESRLEQPSDKESVISTHIEEEKVPLKWILEPASSVPVIPSLPGGALKREFQIAKKESTQKNPFLAFEQEVQHQGLNHTPMATLYTPLHIHLSGGLAQNTLISDGTEGITWLQTLPNEPLPPSSLEKFSLLYAIQIESKNGKIFWVEPKFSSAVPDYLNQIAERILKQMVFKEEKRLVIQSGEIELLFTLPNNTTNIILNN